MPATHARSTSNGTGRYDAVVVGARAAGAATAMLLARQGLDVLVVDRSRYGADTLSTHAIMRGGVLQLHRWGLLDRIVDAWTPPIRRVSFVYPTERVDIALKPAHGVDALYAPRRTVLDPILVDAAMEAGAEVRFGVSVADVLHDRHGRVDGILARDQQGDVLEVRADLVIGADGARSTIAEKVGAPIERAGTGAAAFVYGYWKGLPTEEVAWIFNEDAAGGIIPTNDGESCVFSGGRPGDVGRGGVEALHRMLRLANPEMADLVESGTGPTGVRSFPGRPGFLRRAWGPGWALVGDAGYWKDPVSAHGITDAFRDAELLARAVGSTAPGGAERADALADYQRTRDGLSEGVFTTTDLIARMDWSMTELPLLLMGMAAAQEAEVETLAALPGLTKLPELPTVAAVTAADAASAA